MPLIPIAVAATLKRNALRKGVFGQDKRWRLMAVVVFGLPLARRAITKRADTLAIDTLRPGESITVTTAAPRRRRRS